MIPTVEWKDGVVWLIDQSQLPGRFEILDLGLATHALPVHSFEVRISVDVDGRFMVITLQPNSPRLRVTCTASPFSTKLASDTIPVRSPFQQTA